MISTTSLEPKRKIEVKDMIDGGTLDVSEFNKGCNRMYIFRGMPSLLQN